MALALPGVSPTPAAATTLGWFAARRPRHLAGHGARPGRHHPLHPLRTTGEARGGIVVFECPRVLCKLLSRCHGIDRLVPQGCFLPDYDVHAPLLTLPRIFGTTLGTIPADIPYLFADPELVEKWRQELGGADRGLQNVGADGQGEEYTAPRPPPPAPRPPHPAPRPPHPAPRTTPFRVGISWRGGDTHTQDRHRSISLAGFAPLATVKNIRLFSLQKGPGSEELAAADFPLTDLGCQLDSFMDTAAVLHNLDLLITVDTAIAHCAGGLGVPVWVVLPFAPDWRWMLERHDTPWYPSMRLFRQTRWGNWTDVLEQVTEALRERARMGA